MFLLLSVLCCISCKEVKDTHNQDLSGGSKSNIDWLLGKWLRSNDEAGKMTYEQWQKISDSLYLGLGFTMQQKDTVWKENVRLVLKDTVWSYDVFMSGNPNPTSFLFTQMTDTSFVCENAKNEFPKKIVYEIKGDSMKATISGGGQDVAFLFGKE